MSNVYRISQGIKVLFLFLIGIFMTVPMNGQFHYKEVQPCYVNSATYGEIPSSQWPTLPEMLTFEIDGCLYLVEYYYVKPPYNASPCIQIVGISKLGESFWCSYIPMPDYKLLWQRALIEVINRHPETTNGNNSTEDGLIYHVFNASCSMSVPAPAPPNDPNNGVLKYLKLTLLFDNSVKINEIPCLAERQELLADNIISNVREIIELGSDSGFIDLNEADLSNIEEGTWGIQLFGTYRSCKGQTCCVASYRVYVDNMNEKVFKLIQESPIILPDNYSCYMLQNSFLCEPSCDVFFEEWNKYLPDFYNVIISPPIASSYIDITTTPEIPQGIFLIEIYDYSTNTIVYTSEIIIDGDSASRRYTSNLPPGSYKLKVWKGATLIGESNFTIDRG